MNQYMMIMHLPEQLNAEFISLIPRQRAFIDRLLEEGIVRSYSLSRDRSRVWGVVRGESEQGVRDLVDEFPLRKFVDVEIVELAFNNITISPLLAVSMN